MADMKALHIEHTGEYLIIQIPGENQQHCCKADDAENVVATLTDVLKRAPSIKKPEPEPEPQPDVQATGTDGGEYQGTAFQAAGELLADPQIRTAAAKGIAGAMDFFESISLKRKEGKGKGDG